MELNSADNNVNSFRQNYFYLNLITEGGGFQKVFLSLQFESQKQNAIRQKYNNNEALSFLNLLNEKWNKIPLIFCERRHKLDLRYYIVKLRTRL